MPVVVGITGEAILHTMPTGAGRTFRFFPVQTRFAFELFPLPLKLAFFVFEATAPVGSSAFVTHPIGGFVILVGCVSGRPFLAFVIFPPIGGFLGGIDFLSHTFARRRSRDTADHCSDDGSYWTTGGPYRSTRRRSACRPYAHSDGM